MLGADRGLKGPLDPLELRLQMAVSPNGGWHSAFSY